MTVIKWEFTFDGSEGCPRCQEVPCSELEPCALREGENGALDISVLFTIICRVMDSSIPPGRWKVLLFLLKVRAMSIIPQQGDSPLGQNIYFYSCHMIHVWTSLGRGGGWGTCLVPSQASQKNLLSVCVSG